LEPTFELFHRLQDALVERVAFVLNDAIPAAGIAADDLGCRVRELEPGMACAEQIALRAASRSALSRRCHTDFFPLLTMSTAWNSETPKLPSAAASDAFNAPYPFRRHHHACMEVHVSMHG
jgi:hypothetical protein